MKLTKASVSKITLPPGKAEAIFFDDTLPGFGLRVRAGGKRTWVAQYRIGSKQRRLSLGSLEQIDADEARKRARNALSKVHLGIDPQTEKAEARAGFRDPRRRSRAISCPPRESPAQAALVRGG